MAAPRRVSGSEKTVEPQNPNIKLPNVF